MFALRAEAKRLLLQLGVRYIYQDKAKGQRSEIEDKSKIANLKSKIAALPVELLDRLERAAIRAKMEEVEFFNPSVAQHLTRLAGQFEYSQIGGLVQATKQEDKIEAENDEPQLSPHQS